MLGREEQIILYLTFAKSKLNLESEEHKKAKEEINNLIKELKEESEHK